MPAERRPPVGSLVEALALRAAATPARIAYRFLADGEEVAEELSWGELERRARGLAAALEEAGGRGERALLLYPSGIEFVVAFLGCLIAGTVAVPAHPPRSRRAGGRTAALAADARPALVLSPANDAVRYRAATAGSELDRSLWLAGDAVAERRGGEPLPEPDPGEVAFLQYTSGSTSAPRGVVVRHGDLVANQEAIRCAFRQGEDDVVVGWLPLYHDMGLIGNVLQPLYTGSTCVLMAPSAFLRRPARWLEAISRFRGTTSGGPDFAYALSARRVTAQERRRLDLSSWRVAFCGAEPVRAQTLDRFARRFARSGFDRAAFHPCYGLAEATLMVTAGAGPVAELALDADALAADRVSPAAAGRRRAIVGCGRPAPGGELRVVDPETGRQRPPDWVGEIWVRGPGVTAGYWNRPEETAATFGARLESGGGPFLRTGDLGFLHGGELFVTGRAKDLVILHGRNHYPQDFEASAEAAHPAVRPGAVAAFAVDRGRREHLVIVVEVERGREGEAAEVAEAVRRRVASDHGVPAAAVVPVRAGQVPRTTSGKVRRSACRDLWLGGALERLGAAAPARRRSAPAAAAVAAHAIRTLPPERRERELAVWIARSAGELTGGTVAVDEPLIAAGLDSLRAAELGHRLERELGWIVDLGDLTSGASAAEMAATLALQPPRTAAEPAAPVVPPPVADAEEPLSAGQAALWFLERLSPAAGAYNVAVAARVEGDLDPAALARALERVTSRHPLLCAAFVDTASGPRARPAAARPELVVEPPAAAGADPAARIAVEAHRPFDLERGPLLRLRLFLRTGEPPVLLLTAHHAVCDLWSLALVVRQLGALHAEERGGSVAEPGPPGRPYREVVAAERRLLTSARGEELWSYWRRRLDGAPAELPLPTDRRHPRVQSFAGGARSWRGGAVAEWLRRAPRRLGVPPASALAAALFVLLHRLTGERDLVIAVPASVRGATDGGTVGYLVNPLPVRADLSTDPPFRRLASAVAEELAGAARHRELPFPVLVERLGLGGDAARPPLAQVSLAYYGAGPAGLPGLAGLALGEPAAVVELSGLRLVAEPLADVRVPYELSVVAGEAGEGVGLRLLYNRDLFDAATAERWLGHLGRIVGAGLEDPGLPVSRLPALSAAQRHQLTREWSDGGPALGAGRLLHRSLLAAAARHPDRIAVCADGEALSYGELDARSARLASSLRSLGAAPERVVAVALDPSSLLPVTLLAILRAGAAYLPLDRDDPPARQAAMIDDAGAVLVVSEERRLGPLPLTCARRLVVLDRSAGTGPPRTEVAASPAPAEGLPESRAYLLFTSGSSGRPKPVSVGHGAAVNHMEWLIRALPLGAGDRVLQRTPLGFDASVWELFAPWIAGAALVLGGRREEGDPEAILARCDRHGVTCLQVVPSLLRALLASSGRRPHALARLCSGGEPLPRELAEAARRWGAEVINLYGPTEATIDATWHRLARQPEAPSVPIGRPIAGTRVQVVDRRMRVVPPGAVGELLLAGAGLARGYDGLPRRTAERFVPDPSGVESGARVYRTGDLVRHAMDGSLVFVGRADGQVKVRGRRLEPGEVEAVLEDLPEIAAAAVAVLGDGRLVAYAVPAGAPLDAAAIRSRLRALLPEALVPSELVVLPELPHTPSGKVDRRALPVPSPGARQTAAVPPRTPLEGLVAETWREVLGVDHVGAEDDFFELGGHSLLAAQAASRLREALRREVPVAALFEARTVAALAARLRAREERPERLERIAELVTRVRAMSPEERRRLLAERRTGQEVAS